MKVHPTHKTVDVSDVTYRYDLLCENCDLKDEELEQPCIGKNMNESKRYVVMFNNNRYFKDNSILHGGWWYYKEESRERRKQAMLEDNSTPNLQEARIFNNIRSIISACGAGELAKSRGDYTIIEVGLVSKGVV